MIIYIPYHRKIQFFKSLSISNQMHYTDLIKVKINKNKAQFFCFKKLLNNNRRKVLIAISFLPICTFLNKNESPELTPPQIIKVPITDQPAESCL